MSKLRFGIVGTGFIAGAIADAIARSQSCTLAAVSSRRQATADAFVASRPGTAGVEGWQALVARDDVDAVYVATPTVAKEAIALGAVAAGKHILVDKPFMSAASVRRMSEAAAAAGLLFMDATHFVHNPRTIAIKKAMADEVGKPLSLATAFYFRSTT
ncbi:MAG: Gfo/Idh/MocA family oxidoreductase [Alphaproteobacteria bacterium]